jgi:hypothetical protein
VPKATRIAPVSLAKSINSSGLSWLASDSASHRTNRPSASVFTISTVIPPLVVITSPRRNALRNIAFSTAGINTLERID